jgi:hypothetical protein
MFRPKKIIPKLAVATLALTGCGDDGGGGGNGGGGMSANLTNALNAWCMKFVPCYLEDYPDYTVQECIDTATDNYGLDSSSPRPS